MQLSITKTEERPLHVAVACREEELNLCSGDKEDVSGEFDIDHSRKQTAFAVAAQVGNAEAAKLHVNKRADSPLRRDRYNVLTLHRAAQFGQKENLILDTSHKRCGGSKSIPW
ncbi:hypothetical protein NL676_034992 [Syzygium grande]|nr:hypothetical protein NL676_034992 [Syzygium grande]